MEYTYRYDSPLGGITIAIDARDYSVLEWDMDYDGKRPGGQSAGKIWKKQAVLKLPAFFLQCSRLWNAAAGMVCIPAEHVRIYSPPGPFPHGFSAGRIL